MSPQPYPVWPDKSYLRELIRPWKVVTFAIAMSLLFYGALNFEIGDWDVGITVIMGGLTYLLSPWSVSLILTAIRYRPPYWYFYILIALVTALFVVDWVYVIYHTVAGNPIYRVDNLFASTPVYFMAGVFWLYRGSVRELIANIRMLVNHSD